MSNAERFTPGTKIYYTGDVCNHEAYGEIVSYTPAKRFADNVEILMDDGETVNISSLSFACGDGQRFWIREEWEAHRSKPQTGRTER